MSAIFGIIDRLGDAIDQACVGAMIAALAHRAPDGLSRERGSGFILGHCLLDTAGTGPAMGCLLVEGDFVVTADCRIDNRDELEDSLDVPATSSDTLLLLRAYQRWGEDFPNHILGDFALAIWNARTETLFCARDHFGVKPFYYFNDSRYFVFASEPRAVLASALADDTPSDERIADFLMGLAPPVDQTSYPDVRRLPPAHIGLAGEIGWRVSAYYALTMPAIQARADAPGEFRKILTQAVAARLRGGKFGAALSGGLDSSSIACLAAQLLASGDGGSLPTFSMVFDETPELNERPFIEAVLAQGGFAPAFIPSNRLAHFAALDRVLDEQQDLYLAHNLACSRQIYQRAQAEGVRVLLDGHGGDEIAPVGGGRLDELAAQGRWLTVWRVLDGALIYNDQRKLPTYMVFVKRYGLPRQFLRVAKSILRRLGLLRVQADPRPTCIDADFARRTDVGTRSREQHFRKSGAALTEQAIAHEILADPLQSFGFEELDRTAAAAQVEPRYPFWDKRLVEFCLSLEPAEKLNNGWGRLILRRAMEGILPPAVQWRRLKFDFATHMAISIVRDHRDLVTQTLNDGKNGLGRYVDIPAARLMMERLAANVARPNGYDVQAIFRIMVLAFWLKRQREPALQDAVA